MPTYQYKAVDATGKEQSSTIDAGSEKEAGKKILPVLNLTSTI